MEATAGGPVLHGSCTEAKITELAEPDHPVLEVRERRDLGIQPKLNTKATTFVVNVLSRRHCRRLAGRDRRVCCERYRRATTPGRPRRDGPRPGRRCRS